MTKKQLQLLVVDDEPFNLEIILAHLEDKNFGLHTAQNGEAAWTMLLEAPTRYDLVLLDRMMPKLDGIAVLQRMKKHHELQKIPVIIQTARASEEDIEEGLAAGALFYLTKPFNKNQLISLVTSVTQDRQRYLELQKKVHQHSRTLTLLDTGHFSFQTLNEAQNLASLLADTCPDPTRVVTGLSELLINAVEHGNLGIGYAEKSAIQREGSWLQEIKNRLQKPENRTKKIHVSYARHSNCIEFTIIDEGQGFKWEKYLDLDPARAFDSHGRGIALAKMGSFSKLNYEGCGNKVTAIVDI